MSNQRKNRPPNGQPAISPSKGKPVYLALPRQQIWTVIMQPR